MLIEELPDQIALDTITDVAGKLGQIINDLDERTLERAGAAYTKILCFIAHPGDILPGALSDASLHNDAYHTEELREAIQTIIEAAQCLDCQQL